MSALDLYNRPSPDFEAKVAHSIALLQRIAASHQTLTQASSLGVEDTVVTHLIHLAGIEAVCAGVRDEGGVVVVAAHPEARITGVDVPAPTGEVTVALTRFDRTIVTMLYDSRIRNGAGKKDVEKLLPVVLADVKRRLR